NDTGQLCSIENDTKQFFGVSLGVFLVFDRGAFELDLLDRDQMERLGGRRNRGFSTDLLCEKNAFGGELRPVSWDQDVLEHLVSSCLCFFLTTFELASVLDPQGPLSGYVGIP